MPILSHILLKMGLIQNVNNCKYKPCVHSNGRIPIHVNKTTEQKQRTIKIVVLVGKINIS